MTIHSSPYLAASYLIAALQMIERPLLTPDELTAMPKGQFVVMKIGVHPMREKPKMFFQLGIQFDESNPYTITDHGGRNVKYAEKKRLWTALSRNTIQIGWKKSHI